MEPSHPPAQITPAVQSASRSGYQVGRRTALKTLVPLGIGGLGLGAFLWPKSSWAMDFARPHIKWTEEDFNQFLGAVNTAEGAALMASIEKESTEYTTGDVRSHLNWLRYHTFDPRAHRAEEVDYHEITSWVARLECRLPEDQIQAASTFELERLITEATVARLWESLTPEQRVEALTEIAADGTPENGSELLQVLGQKREEQQREYYESMLITAEKCYTGYKATPPALKGALACRLQSITVNPVLAVTAILILIASIGYILGRASPRKTSVVITQMHLIKVAALEDAGLLNRIIADLKVS